MTGGGHIVPLFLRNYWTNQSEILQSYCLDLSEERVLGSGPKYPEINFSGIWNLYHQKAY